MLMAGNEAVDLGALASGLKFYAAYPMTPSTGIMLYAAGKAKDFGVVVEQAEDAIAAINMALEWGEKIPLGIIYRNKRPILEERVPVIKDASLVRQAFDPAKVASALKEFY